MSGEGVQMITKESTQRYAVEQAIIVLETAAKKLKGLEARDAKNAAEQLKDAFKPEYIK